MSLALPGLFLAGLMSFLSPCILPLVPVYLGLLAGTSAAELRAGQNRLRVWPAALAFSAGLATVFVTLGLVATELGHLLSGHRTLFLQLGGIAVLLLGLRFLGVVEVPWLNRESRPLVARYGRGLGLVGAFFFGAAFALGWTPCVGPILGTVLTYTASTAASPARGALFLGVYALGLITPLVAAAAAAPLMLRWLRQLQHHLRKLEVASGALLVVVGLLMNTNHLEGFAVATAPSPEAPAVAAASAPQAGATCHPEGGSAACSAAEPAPAGRGTLATISGPTMVEFVSRTCTICQRMAPLVEKAEQSCAGSGITVQRVDVSAEGGADSAKQFRIVGVPTFIFLDGQSRELARLIGEQPLSTLEQSLQVLSGQRCEGFRPLPGEHRAEPLGG